MSSALTTVLSMSEKITLPRGLKSTFCFSKIKLLPPPE
jgi:RNase P subunit RPR2